MRYTVYIQQLVRVVIFSWLSVGRVDLEPACRQSTEQHNTCQLLYIYSIPHDDGLQICPKHVEVDWRNKLIINSASSSSLLQSSVVTSPLVKKAIILKWCFLKNIYFGLARRKISLVPIKLYSQQDTKCFKKLDPLNNFFYSWLDSPSGPKPLVWGSSTTLRHTTLGRTSMDEWSVCCRNIDFTTMTPRGTRTRNPSNWEVVAPRLRPRSHWDQPLNNYCHKTVTKPNMCCLIHVHRLMWHATSLKFAILM